VTGTVMFRDQRSGIWGFIRPDDRSPDVFFLNPGIRRGDRVTFDLRPSTRKPGQFEAINIRVLVTHREQRRHQVRPA
jgi:cold shock CspA family protein